jgi:hypothetical protein
MKLSWISNKKITKPFYIEIIILASWSISIVRNNKIFKDQEPKNNMLEGYILLELRMLCYTDFML